ncbi:ribokinase [Pseudohoeflea coraliihabitans]|uniref:Ribokinase n=1 Tax=Pseudohoeflea coraliihabitans TaxID=2860393 RepID=A0ABS6WJT6_9HYPH|nr:ribokinase [Pseudohoeflea sp. DP4N28-3]MBW3096035.1 ribokinase [Pseudohoeflea sp. DP4N28-3]
MSVFILGSINRDLVFSVESLPGAGETISALSVNEYPGGKGANQAIACARAGARTSLLGAVGEDEAGRRLRSNLERAGVDIAGLVQLPQETTGQAIICVARNGENIIVVSPGANHAYRFERGRSLPVSGNGRPVLLSQFEMPVEAICDVIREYRTTTAMAQGTVILNAAPAVEAGRQVLDLADVLVFNETELSAYSGMPVAPGRHTEIGKAARTILGRSDQVAIVTLGEDGALKVASGHSKHFAGYRVDVVDSTGAGDCFCGSLASFLSQGQSFDDAIGLAGAAAALSVMQPGAGPSMPDRASIENFVRTV